MRRIFLVCIGLLLLVPVAWLGATAYCENEFDRAVDALRARGVRVELADFNLPAVPDDQNGAILLRAASAWRKQSDLEACSWAEDIEWDDFLDEEDRAEAWGHVAKWIDAHGPFFERVERAMQLPSCDFRPDRSQGWATIVESIPMSGEIAEAYEWRVRVAEHRDEPAMDSLASCSTVLRWSRRIDRGFAITYMVAKTVDSVACDMLRRVASMRGFDARAARSQLEPLLRAAEDPARLQEAIDGERAVLIYGVRRIATWEGVGDLQELSLEPHKISRGVRASMTALRPLIWRDGVRTLGMWDRAERIIASGGTDTLDRLDALAGEFDWDSGDSSVPPLWRFMSINFRVVPVKIYKSRLAHLAKLRVARVGLACLEFREQHGSWPEGESELLDPFTERPFRLLREGDSLHIKAAVPWLDKYVAEFREERRIYWTLPGIQ